MNSNEHRNKTTIILLGAPGSGKGTQAVKLSKALNIPHISTGDLFRENMRNGTPLGQKAKEFIESGRLVPDSLVIDMLFDRIEKPDCKYGFLLDGFPRTIDQAKALESRMQPGEKVISLNIAVNDDVVIRRIAGRLSCKSCGSIYNIHFAPPKKDHVCDACNGELIHRTDDNEEIVKSRLEVYNKETKPLIDYYSGQESYIHVNGEQDPEVIFNDILSQVSGR